MSVVNPDKGDFWPREAGVSEGLSSATFSRCVVFGCSPPAS